MKNAIALIKANCLNEYHKTCNVWQLSGPRNKGVRQVIYSDLTGAKQTKAASGVKNIVEYLFDYFKPTGNCIAAKEKDLYTIIKGYENA